MWLNRNRTIRLSRTILIASFWHLKGGSKMNVQTHPLDASYASMRTPSSRSTAVLLAKLMEDPRDRHQTPSLGTNTAWALKLKNCVYFVVKELHVEVLSAKPMQAYGPNDAHDMLFEVETSCGQLEVLLDRDGQHSYSWLMNAVQSA